MLKSILAAILIVAFAPLPASAVEDPSWLRVSCSGPQFDKKCNIRFPEKFNVLAMDYYHGGELFFQDKTWTYEDRVWASPEHTSLVLGKGLRLRCTQKGNGYFCELRMSRQFTDININLYSGREYQGGVKIEDIS